MVREYIGGGRLGELAAALDQLNQAGREAERQAGQAEQARALAPAADLAAFGRLADDALGLALTNAGLLDHRGEWRR